MGGRGRRGPGAGLYLFIVLIGILVLDHTFLPSLKLILLQEQTNTFINLLDTLHQSRIYTF